MKKVKYVLIIAARINRKNKMNTGLDKADASLYYTGQDNLRSLE